MHLLKVKNEISYNVNTISQYSFNKGPKHRCHKFHNGRISSAFTSSQICMEVDMNIFNDLHYFHHKAIFAPPFTLGPIISKFM